MTVKYDSFLFDLLSPIINQHEKKSGKWKKKFIFQWWTKCHVQKKNTHFWNMNTTKNKEYVLSKNVLSFCVSGWMKAEHMIIAKIVKEIEKIPCNKKYSLRTRWDPNTFLYYGCSIWRGKLYVVFHTEALNWWFIAFSFQTNDKKIAKQSKTRKLK